MADGLGLPEDANPYYYYDLDWIATVPNMDPWIRSFETLGDVRGGRGQDGLRGDPAQEVRLPHARVHRLGDRHAGETRGGRVRRSVRPAAFFAAGDNQIAGVGDGFERNSPAWVETVNRSGPISPSTAAWASAPSA